MDGRTQIVTPWAPNGAKKDVPGKGIIASQVIRHVQRTEGSIMDWWTIRRRKWYQSRFYVTASGFVFLELGKMLSYSITSATQHSKLKHLTLDSYIKLPPGSSFNESKHIFLCFAADNPFCSLGWINLTSKMYVIGWVIWHFTLFSGLESSPWTGGQTRWGERWILLILPALFLAP